MRDRQSPCRISDDVLDRSVTGINLDGVDLRTLTAAEPTLLLFLRHLG
jgi:hypothetical protein